MRPCRLVPIVLALVAGAAATAAADPLPACPSTSVAPLALPQVKNAVANNRELLIVALGSSSTQGWHSTDLAHSYPAVLQAKLNDALPTTHVAVINKGIGGQDVAEELPRLESDALALHPALVVWQVGANGAMRLIPPETFKRLLTAGIRRLIEAKIDVVVMDNQRAPAILASPEHLQIDQAMAEVAAATGAHLFSRGNLMDRWRTDGFPYDRFIADDGLHHNDYGYHCLAAALASAIVEGLGPDAPSSRTAAKR